MTTVQTFTERAEVIRRKAHEVDGAPMLSKMALAHEVAQLAAHLVADMAAHLDSLTPHQDEVIQRFNDEAG